MKHIIFVENKTEIPELNILVEAGGTLIVESSYNYKSKFLEFNKTYFDNELSMPKFEEFNRPKSDTMAQMTGDTLMEINVAHWGKKNEREQDSIFVHEMIHAYVWFKGWYSSKNIHKGEFHKKAKEIEAMSNLTITGRFTKGHDDDFAHLEKKYAYAVFYIDSTYMESKHFNSRQPIEDVMDEYKLAIKNIVGVKYFPIDRPVAEITECNIQTLGVRVGFLYKIELNTPVGEYEPVEGTFSWSDGQMLNHDYARGIWRATNRGKKYCEFIAKFAVPTTENIKRGLIA